MSPVSQVFETAFCSILLEQDVGTYDISEQLVTGKLSIEFSESVSKRFSCYFKDSKTCLPGFPAKSTFFFVLGLPLDITSGVKVYDTCVGL